MKRHKKMKFALLHLILLSVSYLGFSQCSLSLDVGASGCYWNGSASKTIILAEVSCRNAPNRPGTMFSSTAWNGPTTQLLETCTASVQAQNSTKIMPLHSSANLLNNTVN
jgi:hypothetical protein